MCARVRVCVCVHVRVCVHACACARDFGMSQHTHILPHFTLFEKRIYNLVARLKVLLDRRELLAQHPSRV